MRVFCMLYQRSPFLVSLKIYKMFERLKIDINLERKDIIGGVRTHHFLLLSRIFHPKKHP